MISARESLRLAPAASPVAHRASAAADRRRRGPQTRGLEDSKADGQDGVGEVIQRELTARLDAAGGERLKMTAKGPHDSLHPLRCRVGAGGRPPLPRQEFAQVRA